MPRNSQDPYLFSALSLSDWKKLFFLLVCQLASIIFSCISCRSTSSMKFSNQNLWNAKRRCVWGGRPKLSNRAGRFISPLWISPQLGCWYLSIRAVKLALSHSTHECSLWHQVADFLLLKCWEQWFHYLPHRNFLFGIQSADSNHALITNCLLFKRFYYLF